MSTNADAARTASGSGEELKSSPPRPAWGPVRLELAFAVGPTTNWLSLWKQPIGSLDPLLGRAGSGRAWDPLDGRITELGIHLTIDPAVGYDVVVGVAAARA